MLLSPPPPKPTHSIIFDEGRSGSQMNFILRLTVTGMAAGVSTGVARALLPQVLAGNLVLAPGPTPLAALTLPVSFSETLLHRGYTIGLQTDISLGFIVNWVRAFKPACPRVHSLCRTPVALP